MELNACVDNVVRAVCYRKCLAAAFFMNAAELQKEGEYVTVSLSFFFGLNRSLFEK